MSIESKSGKFYIGDPCYVLSDDIYFDIWEKKYNFEDGVIEVPDKGAFVVHGTAYGDGEYNDQYGNSYGVDSGTLAIIPIELVGKEDGLILGAEFVGTKGSLNYDVDGTFYFTVDDEKIIIETGEMVEEELEESKEIKAESKVTDCIEEKELDRLIKNNKVLGNVTKNYEAIEDMTLDVTTEMGHSYYKVIKNDNGSYEAYLIDKSGKKLGDTFMLKESSLLFVDDEDDNINKDLYNYMKELKRQHFSICRQLDKLVQKYGSLDFNNAEIGKELTKLADVDDKYRRIRQIYTDADANMKSIFDESKSSLKLSDSAYNKVEKSKKVLESWNEDIKTNVNEFGGYQEGLTLCGKKDYVLDTFYSGSAYVEGDEGNKLENYKDITDSIEKSDSEYIDVEFGDGSSACKYEVEVFECDKDGNLGKCIYRKELNRITESKYNLKLSDSDIEYLKKCGYSGEDIVQIERALNRTKYTVAPVETFGTPQKIIIGDESEDKVISAEEARKILGDETFLSGLSRSAFHWTSGRYNANETKYVSFDSSELLEESKIKRTMIFLEELNTGVLPIVDVNMYGMDEIIPESATLEDLDEIIKDIATNYVETTIQDILPSAKIKPTNVYHPKEYNYSGDELEFDLTVNRDEYEVLKEKTLADEEFDKFLKDKYSSYSGFASTMPDNIEEFNSAPEWKQLVQIIMFNLRNVDFNDIQSSYNVAFTDKLAENFDDYGLHYDEDGNVIEEAKKLKTEDAIKELGIELEPDEELQYNEIMDTDYDLVWDDLDLDEQIEYIRVAKSIRRLGPEEAFIDIKDELDLKAKNNKLEKDILAYAYLNLQNVINDLEEIDGIKLEEGKKLKTEGLYNHCYETSDTDELKEIALSAIFVAKKDEEIIKELLDRLTDEEKEEYKEELTEFEKRPYDYIANNYYKMPLELLREIALNAVYVADNDEVIQKEIDERQQELDAYADEVFGEENLEEGKKLENKNSKDNLKDIDTIEELAKYIAENYEKITGTSIIDLFDIVGEDIDDCDIEFRQDIVEGNVDKIAKFIKDSHLEDELGDNLIKDEDFLDELDNSLRQARIEIGIDEEDLKENKKACRKSKCSKIEETINCDRCGKELIIQDTVAVNPEDEYSNLYCKECAKELDLVEEELEENEDLDVMDKLLKLVDIRDGMSVTSLNDKLNIIAGTTNENYIDENYFYDEVRLTFPEISIEEIDEYDNYIEDIEGDTFYRFDSDENLSFRVRINGVNYTIYYKILDYENAIVDVTWVEEGFKG